MSDSACNRHPSGRLVLALFGLAALAGLPAVACAAAATESYTEEAVKAVFLYRFAAYVQWPPAALAAAQFTIAVAGDEPVAAELDRLLPGRRIFDRPAVLRRVRSAEEAADAQMLYIGADFGSPLRSTLAALAGRPILIVTSVPGALSIGSMVNFMLLDKRVRFEISIPAAQHAGLSVSAELLSVAARVYTGSVATPASCTASGIDPSSPLGCERVARSYLAVGGARLLVELRTLADTIRLRLRA